MANKRVLHIIKGLGRGGAERLLLSSIPHHVGYSFDIVYFLPDKNQLVPDLTSIGCRVMIIPSQNVFMMVLQLPKLIRLIRANHYDLLHAHLPWAGILARIAGKITSVPVVYTEHNLFNHYRGLTRVVSRLTFGWQRYVIAVSNRVAEVAHQQLNPSMPVRIIANGVDVKHFRRKERVMVVREGMEDKADPSSWLGFPKGSIIVGTVAGLTRQKRLDRWIQIAEQIAQRDARIHFVVVGDGVDRQALEEQATNLKAINRLRFVGMTSEPAAWLECFDIFLMSSDFEGLPVALLEAMSMECVPVVTPVGGIPAVVQHNKQGFLYAPDQWQEAVTQILMLADQTEKRKQVGAAARQRVVNAFSIERMVQELEEVYAEVLQSKLAITPEYSLHRSEPMLRVGNAKLKA